MKVKQELEELRRKEAKTLLADLEREQKELAKESIAIKLGKSSKVSEFRARKIRVARMMTILGEKVRKV